MNDKHKSKGIAALLLSSGKHSPPYNIFTYKTILRYNQVLTVSTFSLIANREIKYIFKLFSRISSQIYLNPPRSPPTPSSVPCPITTCNLNSLPYAISKAFFLIEQKPNNRAEQKRSTHSAHHLPKTSPLKIRNTPLLSLDYHYL